MTAIAPGAAARIAVALLALAAGPFARAHSTHAEPERDAPDPQVLAPGWEPLAFAPPEPGTYALPPLGNAADGALLDVDGRATTLHREMGDGIAVLSFVYTRCDDVNGCPLAIAVLRDVRNTLAGQPDLAARVRLLTVSFDPAYDTPSHLREFARPHRDERVDWRFLTAASEDALAPLLEAYGQSVIRDRDAQGNPRGTFSHVLRVFLVDPARRIRNVYTVSYLHADTLLADVRTVAMETGDGAAPEPVRAEVPELGPGDGREGYGERSFQTRSRRLDRRPQESLDLLALAASPPLGLPPLPVPADNPLTREKIALGRKLFFDRRLSLNGTVSCAMCHVPDQGFTVNEMATAVGFEGRGVRRNAPTLLNVGHAERLFHDARESRLEQQVWLPLLAANEMANVSVGQVVDRLRGLADYRGRFEEAFAGRPAGMETVGMALASYERTLLAADSPFDRHRYGGETGALGDAARRGLALFTGKARCAACHRIGESHALFTDHALHDTGVGYRRSMGGEPAPRRLQIAPGVFVDLAPEATAGLPAESGNDLGRYEVTLDPADRWKFKTPTLRNVALTAPYMHDGSLPTLESVVRFYARGGVPHELLDPLVAPLELDDGEVADLVAFLEALTGSGVQALVADAFAQPVGDPGGD